MFIRTATLLLIALLACMMVARSPVEAFSSAAREPRHAPMSDFALRSSSPRQVTHEKTRRTALVESATLLLTGSSVFHSQPAVAAYGESSNLELPSYIDYLIEKNASVDHDDFLYKGADVAVQLKRISEAAERLREIPDIATARKWSQVQGTLTGPLGTLIATMNQVSKDSPQAKKAAVLVKNDLYAVGGAAAKKNEAGCIQAAQNASRDLEAFVKLVF